MTSTRRKTAVAAGATQAGGMIRVPAPAVRPPASADELATLSQAERAARALERDRGPREIPIDRAFLEAALDLRLTVRTLVAAFVPRFADWCFVDLLDVDGVPRRVEVAPADPEKLQLAAEMLSLGFGPGWATPSAQAIRDGTPRLYREVSPEIMAWATHDEHHLEVFQAMGPRSLLAVPLVARDRVIGAITVFRSTTEPDFDEWSLVVAGEIAAPAALALDNARAFEAERAARLAAEARVGPKPAAPAKAPAAKVKVRKPVKQTVKRASKKAAKRAGKKNGRR
jgi:hypothetical protein